MKSTNGTTVAFDTAGGIDLYGWWSNPSTGESYQVVDQFFQDNSLYVKTAQGQIMNYNRIQNFVHSDQPITRPIEHVEPQPLNTSKLLEGLDAELADEVDDLLNKPITNKAKETPAAAPVADINTQILEKAFSKATRPDAKIELVWDWTGLDSTLSMLTENMDIPAADIAEYVYNRFLSDINTEIRSQIKSLIDNAVK